MGLKENSKHFPTKSIHEKELLRNDKFPFKLDLQLFAKMPTNDSQIKHIMTNRKGHMPDTPENRALLESVSSDEQNFLGLDSHGDKRYAKIINGKQVWVSVRNNIIQDGGINETPFKTLHDKKGEFKK